MPKFKNQHPNDLISRVLLLEELRTLPAKSILQLPLEFHKFVKGEESTLLNTKGEKVSKVEIDWEYALFEATNKRLYDLFTYFNKVQKEDESNTGKE